MAVRLRDVAEHAGVSVKTVSNVVHGHPSVSRTMRARVQSSIEALGYLPNMSARSLRTGRSGLIGLAIPGLADPYFSRVAEAVIDAAARRGISVLVEQTTGDPTREGDVLLGRRPTIVDGLIFSPISVTQATLDEASPASPLVLLGEHLMASQRSRVAVDVLWPNSSRRESSPKTCKRRSRNSMSSGKRTLRPLRRAQRPFSKGAKSFRML